MNRYQVSAVDGHNEDLCECDEKEFRRERGKRIDRMFKMGPIL